MPHSYIIAACVWLIIGTVIATAADIRIRKKRKRMVPLWMLLLVVLVWPVIFAIALYSIYHDKRTNNH